MDVLYYIGRGSHYQNRELRYSLRALQQHCKDIGNVWVVGNKPPFLADNVRYLWIEDGGEWWQNAYHKTMAAIEAGISENFLLMNDDFFMLKDFEAATYPYYHRGIIPDTALNKYQQAIVNTKRILERIGATTFHYGVHCPMRINTEKYKQLARFYDDKGQGQPVSARCLYGNLFCTGKQVADCKHATLKSSVTGCWSSQDWAKDALEELKKMYPHPSRWENSDE